MITPTRVRESLIGADTTLPLVCEEGPKAHRRGGLSGDEARRRLGREGEREPLPSSRSYKSIVRSNTLTLFNLVLGAFFVLVVVAGRPRDGLVLGVLIAHTAIGSSQ